MPPLALLRRTLVVALVLAASVPSARAGGGTSLDEPPHARPVELAPPPHPGAAHGSARGATLLEDLAPPPAPAATADHSSAVPELRPAASERATAPANAPERRAPDRRERGRAATNPPSHVSGPLTQRAKGASRNTPATPGMGLLLRIGTTAEREISLRLDDGPHAPIAPRPGRAPPGAPAVPFVASASPPCAAPSRALPAVARPTLAGAAALTPESFPADCPCARDLAPARASGVAPRPGAGAFAFDPRLCLVHAGRPKGAAACPTPPFGGSTA